MIEKTNPIGKSATFHFSGDLDHFLSHTKRKRDIRIDFRGNQSVKHLIESIGIPHTEIGVILLNNASLNLDYIVQNGDYLTVAPASYLVQDPRFLLDNHLGKLATYLRMLGFDSLYQNDFQDDDLIEIVRQDARILLTRDRRLLMHKVVLLGYCVRSLDPESQTIEIMHRFHLEHELNPFHRCLRCNSPLQPVNKVDVLSRLQPLTQQYFDEFQICQACNQVYWKGSHYDRMGELIQRISSPMNNLI